MRTHLIKPADVVRKWYIVDASGKSVGRVAAEVARLLRGKHKVDFTPNVDCGDHVIVINCAKAVFTGNKLNQKKYYRHSGYVGGLKTTSASDLMSKNPELVMQTAVKGMTPNNSIGRKSLTRLRAYAGETHEQQSQKPIAWVLS